MHIDCCAACGGGRHNAPTHSPTSQAHYISSCLRTPAARCAAGAHGALGPLYSRQRNSTPAATLRRSWLSCQSQSECVPFANLRKMCSFAKFSTLNLHFASLNAPLRSQNIYIVAKFARCSRSSTLRRKMFNRSAYKHFSLLSHCRSSALPSKMSTYHCSFSRFAFAALLR